VVEPLNLSKSFRTDGPSAKGRIRVSLNLRNSSVLYMG